MRTIVVFTWLAVGFLLQVGAYFGLAARLGIPQSPVYSSPRVPFAGLVFIVGVVMVFLSAVIYELLLERESGDRDRKDDEAAGWWEGR